MSSISCLGGRCEGIYSIFFADADSQSEYSKRENIHFSGAALKCARPAWAQRKHLDKGGGKWQFCMVTMSKLDKLQELVRSYGSVLVAYSGGVDSVFLAKVAHDVLGEKSLAVIADSFSLPRRELQEALTLAERFGFPVRVIKTGEFNNPDYLSNPVNRCFYCKHELFSELEPLARDEGFAVIAYGENASDVGDFRPGARAAQEFEVRAPLKEAGLTKLEIREFSARLGLPTAEKPQMACLSSRIPYGERVTPEKLRMIEEGEAILRDLGFNEVRVRHHELRSIEAGGDPVSDAPRSDDASSSKSPQRPARVKSLARIELGSDEMARFLSTDLFGLVADKLQKLGYAHVTLDLQGYRRGSLNEGITRASNLTLGNSGV